MPHTDAHLVTAPRSRWKLERVLIDRGENGGVWALGFFDKQPKLAFRWNGDDKGPKGNPCSSGHPTWVMMDPNDFKQLVQVFEPDMQAAIRRFLGIA